MALPNLSLPSGGCVLVWTVIIRSGLTLHRRAPGAWGKNPGKSKSKGQTCTDQWAWGGIILRLTTAAFRKGGNSMSKPSTAERRDELHRAIQVKGIRIAIFTLGYWGALLFGANKAAELWPQYFAKAPFWAAVVAFLGFAWNCYRDLGDWRRLTSLETRAEQELDS